MNDDQTRSELFAVLQGLSEKVPDMRAGQLMAALGEVCADLHGRGLWEAEDSEVLEAIWKFRNDFEASAAPAIEQLAATDTAGMYLLKARDPKDFIFTIL